MRKMIKNAVLCFATVIIISRTIDCIKQSTLPNRFHFFDIDLLHYAASNKAGNIMLSPASIKSTLAVLLEGCEGETADEIRRALRLSPDRLEFREQLNVYQTTLQANSSGLTLENANSMFVSSRLRPRKQFLQMLHHVYKAQLAPIDFTDPIKAADIVNGWVSNHTHGLINHLIDPFSITPASSMLILNALYFKSNWKYAFNARLTESGCFYHGKTCQQANIMYLHTELNYALVDNLRAHAVELPYENERYSMILLVPQEKDGCLSVILDLPYVPINQIIELMEPTEVQLALPRFKVNYSDDLVRVLKQTRINSLFTNSANFSGMFEDGQSSYVNSVVHKTMLEVNEEGTVAAAATGAMVVPLIGSETVQLKVDRPFLFFIRDKMSGAILFEGKIEEPELAPSKTGRDAKDS